MATLELQMGQLACCEQKGGGVVPPSTQRPDGVCLMRPEGAS